MLSHTTAIHPYYQGLTADHRVLSLMTRQMGQCLTQTKGSQVVVQRFRNFARESGALRCSQRQPHLDKYRRQAAMYADSYPFLLQRDTFRSALRVLPDAAVSWCRADLYAIKRRPGQAACVVPCLHMHTGMGQQTSRTTGAF